jgi:hypothetical protein
LGGPLEQLAKRMFHGRFEDKKNDADA